MRCNGFGRSAVFAALAAGLFVPWMMAAPAVLGVQAAFELYLMTATAAYLAGLAPTTRARIGAAAATVVAGIAVAVVAGSFAEVLLGFAVVLATGRSGFILKRPPGRAVVIETVIGLSALLFARSLVGDSLLSAALALWGFFLVQSCYFLIGGARGWRLASGRRDPFEAAYERALVLLDGDGV